VELIGPPQSLERACRPRRVKWEVFHRSIEAMPQVATTAGFIHIASKEKTLRKDLIAIVCSLKQLITYTG
jgi:hypothetical protein